MFRYFVQLTFFRISMGLSACAFIGVFVFAVMMEERNVPPAGMRVPPGFQLERAVVSGMAERRNDLSIQHLSSREIAGRLSDIVAEALSFDARNYPTTVAAMQKYFEPSGYEQYRDFLTTSAIQATLATRNMKTGSYVNREPVELAQGVYGGTYKWLFEVPITISFMPRQTDTYRDEAVQPQNREFLLRAQFVRVKDPADPDAIRMELWQILPPRPKR